MTNISILVLQYRCILLELLSHDCRHLMLKLVSDNTFIQTRSHLMSFELYTKSLQHTLRLFYESCRQIACPLTLITTHFISGGGVE